MNSKSVFSQKVISQALNALESKFGERESKNIVRSLREDLPDSGSIQENDELLQNSFHRILAGEPPAYVTGMAPFFGRMFKVNLRVLIPRPETEELVAAALSILPLEKELSVLDIGTGSGCIGITIGLERPFSQITATDISENALQIARENATTLGLNSISFILHDFLSDSVLPRSLFDLVISNPPYIGLEEKKHMSESTIVHEPAEALFPNHPDPLIFYRKMAGMAGDLLNPNGALLVEINEFRAEETVRIFEPAFKTVDLKKDMQGKSRLLVCRGLIIEKV